MTFDITRRLDDMHLAVGDFGTKKRAYRVLSPNSKNTLTTYN
jgi:hypothetical protein